MTFTYTYSAHEYMFRAESDHRQHECTWCRQARETALSHMRDTTLKTTKSTKYEIPTNIPHTVHVTRMYGQSGPSGFTWEVPPLVEQINFTDTTGKFGVSGTYVRQSEGLTLPVVLDLTEAEAATVLGLLDAEEERQSDEADAAYQNGDGFEGECVQARTLAADAVKIADRLRKALAEHLDKAYAGELGS